MKKLNRKNIMNDRGSTFIEIIVSVLIVGIVFVPLLLGLNTAIMVNRVSQNEMYADTVAQNGIETVKALGKKGIEAKISGGTKATNSDGTDPDLAEKIKILYGIDISEPEAETPGAIATPTPTLIPLMKFDEFYSDATIAEMGTDKYVVSGIKQGTKDYFAEVEFLDEYSGTGMQNDPNGYSNIDTTQSTVNIHLSGDNDFTTVAGLIAEAAVNGKTLAVNDVIGYIKSKTTCIKLEKYSGDAVYGNKYVIWPSIEYKVYSQEVQGDPSTKVFNGAEVDEDGDNVTIKTVTLEPMQFDVCPKKIMLFTDPLTDVESSFINFNNMTTSQIFLSSSNKTAKPMTKNSSGGDRSYANEYVKIDKCYDKETSVYLFITSVDITQPDKAAYQSSKMNFIINNTSSEAENVKIFSPVPVGVVSGTGSTNYAVVSNIVNAAGEDDITKMYKVRITVHDMDSDYKLSRESTILG